MSRVAARRPFLNPRLGAVALACASVLLASCGGGDRKSYFTPDNIVTFGDENSAITADSTSTLLDQSGAATTLKGLIYTAQPVVVYSTAVCAYDPTPNYCTSNSGAAFTFASENYYVLSSSVSQVTRRELDAGPTNQRTTVVDYACDVATNWVQIVARAYGKGYTSQCPQDPRGGAANYATLGAKTADVISQINAHRGEISSKTIVTIMVGQNDILEQYAVAAGGNESGAITELQNRAANMAATIKDLIGLGAKVILALTPDLSETPYGVSVNQAQLDRLVRAYNDRLYITGLGNVSGRSLAGMNPESLTQPGTRSTSYDYTTTLCNASAVRRPDGTTPSTDDEKLLYCTSQYYNTSGTVSSFTSSTAIWADAKRAAPLLHNLIGVTAYNRAHEQF